MDDRLVSIVIRIAWYCPAGSAVHPGGGGALLQLEQIEGLPRLGEDHQVPPVVSICALASIRTTYRLTLVIESYGNGASVSSTFANGFWLGDGAFDPDRPGSTRLRRAAKMPRRGTARRLDIVRSLRTAGFRPRYPCSPGRGHTCGVV